MKTDSPPAPPGVDTRSLLYAPSADRLRQQLPDIAEGLHAQLSELQARPSPDGAERLAHNLDGARRIVLAFRERLMVQGEANGS